MPFEEVLKTWRGLQAFQIKPPAEFLGDVFRRVPGPAPRDIEGNHSDWVAVLACQHVGQQSFRRAHCPKEWFSL